MSLLNRLVQNPMGALGVLAIAAFLEAWGDSFFQAGFYRSSGFMRFLMLLAGTAILALYGSTVNLPRWDFGRLLGVYVALFFLAAQLLARIRFGLPAAGDSTASAWMSRELSPSPSDSQV